MKPRQRLRLKDVQAAIDWQSPDPQGVDTSTRRNVQHEAAEQRALWRWVQAQPFAAEWAHWPNERPGKRTYGEDSYGDNQRVDLSKQGVRKGMPDNWLFLPLHGHPGAVSELKRQGATRSTVSAEQRSWLMMLEAQGWAVGVHRGWVEASEFFKDYIRGHWAPDPPDAWWR